METGSKGRIDTRKENIIYVGIDLHKETHTAVMLDCWNQKLGEITFDNKPSVFHKLTRKQPFCDKGKDSSIRIGKCLWLWSCAGGVAIGKGLRCERREHGVILCPEKKRSDVSEK